VVHHRIHRPGRHAEEEARSAELGEIPQVVPPVGLGHNRHTIPFGFEQTAHDGRAERRVVDVGIAREEDHVELIPAACADFLEGSGQKHFNLDFYSSASPAAA
jgi:hypothetical protein